MASLSPCSTSSSSSSSAVAAAQLSISDVLLQCADVEAMIELNSAHLERLRSMTRETADRRHMPSELTKQEIRTHEGKLIKHFSKQLALRTTFLHSNSPAGASADQLLKYPSLKHWLTVVGVTPEAKEALLARIGTFDSLREKTESELHRLLLSSAPTARLSMTHKYEDLRRLSRALQSLRRYTDILLHGTRSGADPNKMELHWDSWSMATPPSMAAKAAAQQQQAAQEAIQAAQLAQQQALQLQQQQAVAALSGDCSSPRPYPCAATSSSSSSSGLDFSVPLPLTPKADSAASSLSSNSSLASSIPPPSPGVVLSPPVINWPDRSRATPPTTPPWSAAFFGKGLTQKEKFPTTPPPNKKHSTLASSCGTTAQIQQQTAAKHQQQHQQQQDYPLTKSVSHECELGNRINPQVHLAAATMTTVTTSNSGSAITTPVNENSCPNVTSILPRSRKGSSADILSEDHSTSSSEATSKHATPMNHPRRKLTSEPAVDEPVEAAFDMSALGGASPLASPNAFDAGGVGGSSDHLSGYGGGSRMLQVPKSPRTPRSMGHAIRHRFKKKIKPARCDFCMEMMFNGLKCKECKFKCHRDCESKVPPSCGLPEDLLEAYVKKLTKDGSPILPRPVIGQQGKGHLQSESALMPRMHHHHLHHHHPGLLGTGAPVPGTIGLPAGVPGVPGMIPPYPDSSSNTSSCNSSTPSSPAIIVTATPHTPPHSATSMHHHYNNSRGSKFTFPDPPITLKLTDAPVPAQKVTSPNPIIDSVKSYDSDKTLSGTSGSSGSQGTTCRLDSQDSTASVDGEPGAWTAGRQTSISLREWDIPYEELDIGDKIGSGRFSTVHRGNWHGAVAIKILNMDNLEEEATLEAFRSDVLTFRKTRHENLILFMGACMNPPKLAIVTSLCKGNTLYTHLHLRRDKFQMNKLVQIAQQIAQGMGYLHHKNIVHNDLKTKNVFLENGGRAIIADFGLVNVARRLCSSLSNAGDILNATECMSIPKGWLCYLAPEIMRALRINQSSDEKADLPFTKQSDVFAYGTVWYELLTTEWPWNFQPPETIIWLVGKGMKPSLSTLQASREVKDILLMCWTFKPEHRPDFTHLSKTLEKIPKKRGLIRSLSQSNPIHLSKSAESVF